MQTLQDSSFSSNWLPSSKVVLQRFMMFQTYVFFKPMIPNTHFESFWIILISHNSSETSQDVPYNVILVTSDSIVALFHVALFFGARCPNSVDIVGVEQGARDVVPG